MHHHDKSLTSPPVKRHAIRLCRHGELLPRWNSFCDVKASPVAFCMQCGPECLDWRPHDGGHGAAFCMVCVDAPLLPHWGGFCILPPVLCCFFLSNSTFFLQVSVVQTDLCGPLLCRPSRTVSLAVFIWSFQAAASFFLSFFFSAACCLHSFGVFLPARRDCYKPICFCAFAIIQGWLRILCTLTLKEHRGQRW